jgi:SAM-dependent methyltransferase
VLGVDYSEVAIERARTLAAAEPESVRLHVDWRVSDVTAEPPAADRYDLTIVSYVHIEPADLDPLLRAAARSVHASGWLVVVGHDRRNIAEGVGGPQDPARLYVPDDLRALAIDCGLDVDVATTAERPTDDGVALDAIMRARRPAPA